MTGIVGAINAAQRAKNRYRDSDPARLALEGGRPSSERIGHGVGGSGRVVDQAKVP